MATQPYIVIRLVPDAPIDGATFATYLNGLQLQLIDAYTGAPLSDYVYASPLLTAEQPAGYGPENGAVVSVSTATGTPYVSSGDYGSTLTFDSGSTAAISVGSFVFTTDTNNTIPDSPALTVTDVTATTVTLSGTLSNYVPAGMVVSFAPPNVYTWVTSTGPPAPSFTITTSAAATDPTGQPPTSTDPAVVLPVASVDGILVGMGVTGAGGFTGIAANTTVAAVNTSPDLSVPVPSFTLSQGATGAGTVPAGTSIALTWLPSFVSLTLTPSSGTGTTLNFTSPPNGVGFGMTLSPLSGYIAAGTTVVEATTTTVTLSKALLASLTAGQTVTFNYPLSSGVVQDYTIDATISFTGLNIVIVPNAVATAVVPLNSTSPPAYLDIKIVATRYGQTLPFDDTYYNVLYSQDALPSPNQYQSIPPNQTGLYLSLPPPPLKTFNPLTIPSDGSPPPFDGLLDAIENALANDPVVIDQIAAKLPTFAAATTADCPSGTTQLTFSAADIARIAAQMPSSDQPFAGLFTSAQNIAPNTTVQNVSATTVTLSIPVAGDVPSGTSITFTASATLIAALIASPTNCSRIAYDIVWSYQNTLPLPPDTLDNLYTNPPNPGGSADDSSSSTNNYEQDRIKFEGTLNSFYATRNADAERLTKFVAAASAAVYCEQTSLNSSTALLEFPVDPSAAFATAVYSELLVQGVGEGSIGGVVFGVPAAFFYVLGATLDQSHSATQRFQTAIGDSIDRVLQQFSVALNSNVINPTEAFVSPGLDMQPIGGFQAARRLAALGVSAASTTPMVTAYAGSPLTALIADWLSQPDPTPVPPPNPLPSYESNDFAIWTKTLAAADPQGYLYLDLDALTRGYIIPAATEYLLTAAASGSTTLTFTGSQLGIGPGMPVSGAGVAPGTVVTQAVALTTVTLSLPLATGGVSAGETITFGSGTSAIAASPSANIAAGSSITLPATAATAGITPGMPVSGAGVALTTTVSAVATVTTVTLSAATTGALAAGEAITFNASVAPLTLVTTADCPSGSAVLTFGSAAAALTKGLTAFGPNIPSGTAVTAVSPTTATLNSAVTADVPTGTSISFATVAGTLADQIFAWLPSTANPSPPLPTITTLEAVTAAEWTSFFTVVGNQTWLPPFTRPVAPGVSTTTANVSSGYTALRIRAFIRAVQEFFAISTATTTAQLPSPGAPPTFKLPAFDPISLAVANLPTGFVFSGSLSSTDLATAVDKVFSASEPVARAWLTQTMTTISQLSQVASVVGTAAAQPSLQFSIVEALYARGFRTASDITGMSAAEFQQALTGTVAYDFANSGTTSLYQQAATLTPPPTPPGQEGGSFQPINDGSLVDCVPPPCLSPTSPIAYLNEMLALSQASTCDDPQAAPSAGQISLGAAVQARRGPIGTLLASCANLETPLPLIDIVDENLEYLAYTQPPAGNSTTSAPCGTVYNTSADKLAGFTLCSMDDCKADGQRGCHEPAPIFAALPEYSTPATPVVANQAVEPLAFNNLKNDFSSCELPYSQALDVSRTYLHHTGSCRFEELRTFRKCITEFALAPASPPAGFQSHLWRYPVRIETAIEYLGITPEEYTTLFAGTAAQPCAAAAAPNPNPNSTPPDAVAVPGAPAAHAPIAATAPLMRAPLSVAEGDAISLPDFLSALCLSYCEVVQLSQVGLLRVAYVNDGQQQLLEMPECEPCCLGDYKVVLPDGGYSRSVILAIINVFVRLWRKLQQVCGARYTFPELFDICTVLQLTTGAGLNPEFIRQLAAFQMLRDQFALPLREPTDHAAGVSGADRTHLLALWVGSSAGKWNWAVRQLVEGVEHHARHRYGGTRARGEFGTYLIDNLDALSRLAGFNPPTATDPSTDTWNSTPGCTLRFAEVLAKMAASNFRIGELLYLFNATPPQDAADPFPLQDPEDVSSHPLGLPEDTPEEALWRLREALLAAEACEEEAREWSWSRIAAELRDQFGYAPPASGPDPLLSLGQHFFPDVLATEGFSIGAAQRQYRVSLTSSTDWSSPSASPFQYDSSASQLAVRLPLRDEAVAATLSQLPQLNAAEQAAVQDLYYAPRVDLALLASLFPDWQAAETHLIEERDEHRRWEYFRRHFALANIRRRIIAEHLARHVERYAGQHCEDLAAVAGLILSHLSADENTGTPWESDSGLPPTLLWQTAPSGGAIAALLGLVGTGLLGEYQLAQSQDQRSPPPAPPASGAQLQLLWREVRGPLTAFGHQRDSTNSPVPTVLPALGLSPAANPLVVFQNGYADRAGDGLRLGGVEAFQVRWSGALLIEREGEYAFHAGAPTPDGERPEYEKAAQSQWRLTLKRGQKTWTILNHQWPGDTTPERSMPRLRRGAYHIVAEYRQPAPDFSSPPVQPRHSGFQVKYAGPDSAGRAVSLPLHRLYREHKNHTLDQGITFLPGSSNAQAFLKSLYTSTLRDIRRTYQRAFKAVLFAGRLGLSARRNDAGESELGYMLDNPALFAGHAYYRTSPTTFAPHLANFDFDLLPLQDNYEPPTAVPPDRSTPSLQRTQAMADWFERTHDYDVVRRQVQRRRRDPVWHLFAEAARRNPTNAGPLLEYIGADPQRRALDLRFYQDQSSPIYTVSSADLEDDRWLVRVWHADCWIRRVLEHFHPKDIATARPDLWASQDPSATMPASGASQTGNANLQAFLDSGYLENGEPRRYLDLKRLNDGLRERGRRALIAYLCSSNRVQLTWLTTPTYATQPRDLSDLLLMDVEAGLCEKASRIDEAITAVQSFVQRARLGLEPAWKVGHEFMRLWQDRFASYRTWERSKRRELYRENWIEWSELGKARRIEAFRFLETTLRTATLSLAAPGGLDWWADDNVSLEHVPELVQRRVPSKLHPLTAPPQSATREGLGTLDTPEYTDEPTWLAPVPSPSATTGAGSNPSPTQPPSSGANGPGASSSPPGTVPNPTSPPGSDPNPTSTPAGAAPSLRATGDAQAIAYSPQSQPRQLPFWMESAIKLGSRFLRVAAAGVPQAGSKFVPQRDEPRSTFCAECGHEHSLLVDEYYFWLVDTEFYAYTDNTDAQDGGDASFTGSYQLGFQDSYWDPFQQQSSEWDDEDQVPPLLARWQPSPAVRLAWCRVHNGQFQQARKSDGYVPISSAADLIFLGRAGDSVYFQVSGAATPPPPGYTDPSPPGFRFDLPTDEAVALPQVIQAPWPAANAPYPGGLQSYPFFAYEEPGARLFPDSWFSPARLVADALRANCRFDLALKWYQRAFDPLQRDCTWMDCSKTTAPPAGATTAPAPTPQPTHDQIAAQAYRIWVQHGRAPGEQTQDWLDAEVALKGPGGTAAAIGGPTDHPNGGGACCDSANVGDRRARERTLTLDFCQTLLDWGEFLVCRHPTPERLQQARLLVDTAARITGPRPRSIPMPEPKTPVAVSGFRPAFAPLNPRLLDLYDTVAHRRALIHHCIDSGFCDGERRDARYFGDSSLRGGWRELATACDREIACCCWPSPYRFTSQIRKALELAAKARELGDLVLSIHEKGDAEMLASLHAGQERELLALSLSVRQDQWRDADWQIQALQQAKEASQISLIYYTNLYQNGLINDEIQNITLATNAMQTRTASNLIAAVGECMVLVPDAYVGAMSTFSHIPLGTKLAGLFNAMSRIVQTVADIESETAAIDLTEGNWQRRSDEWFKLYMHRLPSEIQQIELQILGAHRRRDQALQELNNQQRQIENAVEVENFLRDKFTATELYLYLLRHTAELHSRMYKLAHCAALEAQRAFNFELGHTTERFIPEDGWDSLHDGLMAGHGLECALQHMDKAYQDRNIREYELTKHFSLRLHFPLEFMRLRATGRCDIRIPEWMYDLDYPGHYMRRIRSISLTIPCVTGPYTGVHCRMTLLDSETRIDPRLEAPPTRCCCCDPRSDNGYEACPHDRRIVRTFGALEAIATSSGQDDSGLHERSFRDERYLPFEFHGAHAHLLFELPPENNYFPRETLTDLLVHVSYTSREGHRDLRRAAAECAERHLPGSGWCFVDVRHEFPDAWQLLQGCRPHQDAHADLRLRLERRVFPFIPGGRDIRVSRVAALFSVAEREHDDEPAVLAACPCPPDERRGAVTIEVTHGARDRHRNATPVTCLASDEWPDLYRGEFDVDMRLQAGGDNSTDIGLRFPADVGVVENVYLLCRYEREQGRWPHSVHEAIEPRLRADVRPPSGQSHPAPGLR